MTIQICMGGYGPPTTTHSRALKIIGDRLAAQFGKQRGRVAVSTLAGDRQPYFRVDFWSVSIIYSKYCCK